MATVKLGVVVGLFLSAIVWAAGPRVNHPGVNHPWWEDPRCPGSGDPAPPILKADLPRLSRELEGLRDQQGRSFWQTTPDRALALLEIVDAQPPKTKLEQFFQLMFLIQKQATDKLPLEVTPPGITEVLLAARVFSDPAFPKEIVKATLAMTDRQRPPVYRVYFEKPEVRFPLNEGKGFSIWQQGKCQVAKELVFQNGFSFRLRRARHRDNLVVYDFDKVQLYGDFGARRKFFSVDLSYVDLEKVEFVRGTDEGKVTVRVSKREFDERKHSALFRFLGTLIPDTSRQRIDW
ncbi:MAG: hypothetical protein HYS22_03890 [Deltaproteobacteria bacterium]|nr:hypothetical protein [Deltaproteobacteria bacterium]